MNKFNIEFSLAENIKGGLWAQNKNIEIMAKELDISKQNISVAISRSFVRNGNISPQNKKMIIYLENYCIGFKEWAEENKISIDS